MSHFMTQLAWFSTVVVLTLGPALIVGAATVGVRRTRSAAWQRVLWQAAASAILLLLLAEATGTAAGFAQWLRGQAVRLASWRETLRPVSVTAVRAPGDAIREPESHPTAARFRGIAPPTAQAGDVAGGTLETTGRITASDALGDRSYATRTSLTWPEASSYPSRPDDAACDVASVMHDAALVRHTVEPGRDAARLPENGAPRGWPLAREVGYGLVLLWAAGSGLLLLRMAATYGRLWRFASGLVSVRDAAVSQRLVQLADRLKLRRRVPLCEAPGLATPIAIGWLRPRIVLPTGFVSEFDGPQQDAMLAHELAHVVAGDGGWQVVVDLVAALWWWHPLVWWVRRQWRAAGELAADEACLAVPRGADTLAACLVTLARRLESRPRLGWMAMVGPGFRSALGRRVERLLSLSAEVWQPPARGQLKLITGALPVALLVVAVSGTAWARTQAPFSEGAPTMKMFLVSWRQSLAAATLAALLSPVGSGAGQAVAAEGPPPGAPRAEERKPDKPAAREGREERKPDAPGAREGRGERRPDAPAAREGERERRPAEARERREGEPRERREGDARGHREGEGREGEPRLRELQMKRRQLEEEAAGIRRKLEGLKPDQEGERRELKAALERIMDQHRRLQGPPRDLGPERERLRARLDELKDAIHRAREAGRADEAERLEREARELMQVAQRMMEQRPGEPGRRGEEGERERRLHHLRVAIENLRAAGMHEPAEALTRQLEQGLRDAPPGERGLPGAPIPPHFERGLQELREQMQDLRRQMDEMRQHLRELAERRRG